MSPLARWIPSPAMPLQREFKDIQNRLQLTGVLVTHDMTEALLMADRICGDESGAGCAVRHAQRSR